MFDLCVIGGGINGAGIARDAAGRGLSVCLCEKGDLAQATSSASTKLIHGGLRYLEHGAFRLVKESLREREILLRMAPHIVWPMRFVLPHQQGMRPAWMIRAGLFVYDHLGNRGKLPTSHAVDFKYHLAGEALEAEYKTGFIYSDCWVQDARLVILNAMDAHDHGATILPRTECITARRQDGIWHVTLKDATSGGEKTIQAKLLVNATGPFASQVMEKVLGIESNIKLRLVKGSHIIVPRLYDHSYAYLLQNDDKRVVFAIPYEKAFTLIGTTEVPFNGDPATVAISTDEKHYLCDAANRYFSQQLREEDICWSYSGVRPLMDDGSGNISAISREYRLDWNKKTGEAPLLTVYGGKLTTYRALAEKAVDMLAPHLGCKEPRWTAQSTLPGGNMGGFSEALRQRYSWLPAHIMQRYLCHYGTLVTKILQNAKSTDDLGKDFGAGFFEAELDYLKQYEWAMTAEDILWRRTKLGLFLKPEEITIA